jgi:hypothetical protein
MNNFLEVNVLHPISEFSFLIPLHFVSLYLLEINVNFNDILAAVLHVNA